MASPLRTLSESVRVALVGRVLGALAVVGRHGLGVADDSVRARDQLEDRHVRLDDGDVSRVADVRAGYRALGNAVRREVGSAARDHAGRSLRRTGILLLALTASAFALAVGLHPVSRPPDADLPLVIPMAIALSGLVVGVQAQLAVHVGRALYRSLHRHRGRPTPDTGTVLGCGTLAMISVFTAAALLHWLRLSGIAGGDGPAGTALGLVVGGAAIAAPWMVVAGVAYAPSPARRRYRVAGDVLCWADRERRALEQRAARGLARLEMAAVEGQRLRRSAEAAAQRRGEPWDHPGWSVPADELMRLRRDGCRLEKLLRWL